MSLIQKTHAQIIAEDIDQGQAELLHHVEAMLCNFYAKVNTPGLQQEILNAFASNAVKAVSDYAAMFQAVSAINPNTTAPAPVLTVFVPQPDGTVLYVAPLEPVMPEIPINEPPLPTP